jgi:hypothetical protein
MVSVDDFDNHCINNSLITSSPYLPAPLAALYIFEFDAIKESWTSSFD